MSSFKSAVKLTSAYAEATTAKIAVIVGKTIGSAYIALAGTGANADAVYALPEAVISPVNVEAAAFIMAEDKMNVPVSEQQAAAEQFAAENLSAFNAAQNGYVDGIVRASRAQRNAYCRAGYALRQARSDRSQKAQHSLIPI